MLAQVFTLSLYGHIFSRITNIVKRLSARTNYRSSKFRRVMMRRECLRRCLKTSNEVDTLVCTVASCVNTLVCMAMSRVDNAETSWCVLIAQS